MVSSLKQCALAMTLITFLFWYKTHFSKSHYKNPGSPKVITSSFLFKFWSPWPSALAVFGTVQVPAAREVGLLHLCEFIEARWLDG